MRLRLPARVDTGNRNGSMHGGVIASLLDVAGMIAARSVAPELPDDAGTSTIDLAVHYLAPAVDEAVVVDGTVTRRGREIVFVEASVTGAGGTPIARSVGASVAAPSERRRRVLRPARSTRPRRSSPAEAAPRSPRASACSARAWGRARR